MLILKPVAYSEMKMKQNTETARNRAERQSQNVKNYIARYDNKTEIKRNLL